MVITSATLDGQKFSKYFSNCPVVNVPGKLYPVQLLYSEEPPQSYLESSVQTAMGECTQSSCCLVSSSCFRIYSFKKSGYNLVTYHNRTPIFEWCLLRCVSKNKHHLDMHSKEIGLFVQNLLIFLGLIVNIVGGTCIHSRRTRIFTLIVNKRFV